MASLIAAAFLSCCWFTSSLGQIVPLIEMSRSHCSSNSSFIISQKLCSTQQAAITVQQLFKFRSSRFASAGNLPFNLPYPFSTTTLVMLRRFLNCNSCVPQRSGFLGPRTASSVSLAVGNLSLQELVVAPSHH